MSAFDCRFIGAAELDREGWLALSAAVAAFERANRQSDNADPAEFLMDGPPDVRLRTLVELLKVDLEHRWERSEPARIEEYFERWPELARLPEARRELLEAECVTRCGFGRVVTRRELEERFPEQAASIDLEAIHRDVAAQGWSAVVAETIVPGSDTPGIGSRVETPVLDPGTRIGKYVIRGVIGRGGMGIVYRAHDPSLERDVALKLPKFGGEADPELLDRFRTEVKRAAAVDHPHLCSIYDADVADGRAYLAMELIDGETIAERLRSGALPPREAVSIARKVARALGRLHAAGIVHRDISAANVMLDGSDEPRLMDFGLARVVDDRTQWGTRVLCSGTPAYIAPELLSDRDSQPDARTDVYSLGVLLCQMLTGALPTGTESTGLKPSRTNSRVDRRLDLVCSRATEADPGARFATAGQFDAALSEYADRTGARSRRAWIVTAGGLAVGGVALFVSKWRNSTRDGLATDNPELTGSAETDDSQAAIGPSEPDGGTLNRHDELVAELESIRSKVDDVENRDDATEVHHPEVIDLRARLLAILRSDLRGTHPVDAARELVRLAWPGYVESPQLCRWWNRLPLEHDPTTPIDAGPLNGPEDAHLASGGTMIIAGQVAQEWEHHQFRLWVDDPRGFFIRIIALTSDLEFRLNDHWHSGLSDTASPGRFGHTIYPIREVPKPDNNSHRFFFEGTGRYLLHIWQPVADPP